MPELPEDESANAQSSASRRLSAALDITFRSSSPNATASWREGRFSDWVVNIGSMKYPLHAFTLARASLFFENQMEQQSQLPGGSKRETDLTDVLPESCWGVFDTLLDFLYSDNQAFFEIPASKALLLLKSADILGMPKLFECAKGRVVEEIEENAPILSEQFCSFHVPGSQDSAMLQVVEECVRLIIERFQSYLARPDCRESLLRLPQDILLDILGHDDLAVASEDDVGDFMVAYTKQQCSASDLSRINDLWRCVRWSHLGVKKFNDLVTVAQGLLSSEILVEAYTCRLRDRELQSNSPGMPSRRTLQTLKKRIVRPPEIPPPSSTDIDFCIYFGDSDRFALGQSLRSEPLWVGDLVLRVLVFPCGTNTGVAHGSLSVFLEAVPQSHWPPDWEFSQIKYSIVCYRWPAPNADRRPLKRKVDTWTFRSSKLDRGWHDFLQPSEVKKFVSPSGFLLIRGSIEASCLSRTFLNANEAVGQNEIGGMPSAGPPNEAIMGPE